MLGISTDAKKERKRRVKRMDENNDQSGWGNTLFILIAGFAYLVYQETGILTGINIFLIWFAILLLYFEIKKK